MRASQKAKQNDEYIKDFYVMLKIPTLDKEGREYINLLEGLGNAYYSTKQFEKAIESFQVALSKRLKLENDTDMCSLINNNIGNYYCC